VRVRFSATSIACAVLVTLAQLWLAAAASGEPRLRRFERVESVLALTDRLAKADQELEGAHPAKSVRMTLRGTTLRGVFQHPASRLLVRDVAILARTHLVFSIGLSDEAWAKGSDGVEFSVEVRPEGGKWHEVFKRELGVDADEADRGWQDVEVSLHPFAGQRVDLVFETMPGLRGSAGYDWAYWGEPRLVASGVEVRDGSRPNLLLVSFDTLRADYLGSYGHAANTSPTIDALAARGARFERVVAQAPWTLPSHFSMLTGLYPDREMLRYDESPCAISPTVQTLAEILADNRYSTAAFTGGGFVSSSLGFGQGFDRFESHGRRFEDNLPAIHAWLERHAGSRFFLFVHHFNVHRPYAAPDAHLSRFIDEVPTACRGVVFSQADLEAGRWQACLRDPHGVDYLRAAYEAEISNADDLLSELLTQLSDLGVLDDTLVVVTADHGEELMDHGSLDHVRTLYDEVIRVPLIIAGPGVEPGVRVPVLAGLTDVVPTLLELLWPEATGMAPEGRSHADWLTGAARVDAGRENAPIFTATELDRKIPSLAAEPYAFKAAVVRGTRKLIRSGTGSDVSMELFDHSRDPHERQPSLPSRSAEDQALKRTLEAWVKDLPRARYCVPRELEPETRDQLEALGYLN